MDSGKVEYRLDSEFGPVLPGGTPFLRGPGWCLYFPVRLGGQGS